MAVFPLDRVQPEEHGQWQWSHWVVYSLRNMVSGSGSTGSCTAYNYQVENHLHSLVVINLLKEHHNTSPPV